MRPSSPLRRAQPCSTLSPRSRSPVLSFSFSLFLAPAPGKPRPVEPQTPLRIDRYYCSCELLYSALNLCTLSLTSRPSLRYHFSQPYDWLRSILDVRDCTYLYLSLRGQIAWEVQRRKSRIIWYHFWF